MFAMPWVAAATTIGSAATATIGLLPPSPSFTAVNTPTSSTPDPTTAVSTSAPSRTASGRVTRHQATTPAAVMIVPASSRNRTRARPEPIPLG